MNFGYASGARAGMLPTHQVETYLQHFPSHLRDIVLELRNIILTVAPDAVEVIRWKGLSYLHEGRGGVVSAGICQIGIQDDRVHLGFIHGAYLPDPRGLLEGSRKAKRFVRIESFDQAPWEDLKDLIIAASNFDPRALQP